MIRSRLSQFQAHLRLPLYANAYFLIGNQIANAGLGVIYWMVAARLYTPDIVGVNVAILSSIALLAAFAEFSLRGAAIRFVPRAGRHIGRLVLAIYAVNIIMVAVMCWLFISGYQFALSHQYPAAGGVLGAAALGPGWLILITIFHLIFYVQDGVLIGLRQARWVWIENSIYGISKIMLLIPGLYLLDRYGIVMSWYLPMPFLILFFNILILGKLIPAWNLTPTSGPDLRLREITRSITGDYIGTSLSEAGVRILPLLVVALLGSTANAYFYQSWLISSTLTAVVGSMASSFTVEASANLKRIPHLSRRILRQAALLIVPIVAVTWIAAKYILLFFGAEYVAGSDLLRWLAAAALPIILNFWYLAYSRVTGRILSVIVIQAIVSALTLLLSYLLIPVYGITGVGVAWFVAQTLVACFVAIIALPVLKAHDDYETA
jgi:O-antigen/teichoic acid export membrane protein